VLLVAAWLLFVGGLVALGWLDYTLRMRDGSIDAGGIGEPLVHVLVLAMGVVCAALAWRGLAGWSPAVRLVLLATQLALGFFAYAWAAIAYVCGTGIDCF